MTLDEIKKMIAEDVAIDDTELDIESLNRLNKSQF